MSKTTHYTEKQARCCEATNRGTAKIRSGVSQRREKKSVKLERTSSREEKTKTVPKITQKLIFGYCDLRGLPALEKEGY